MSSPNRPLDDLRIERRAERQPHSRLWTVAVAVAGLGVTAGVCAWWFSRSGGIEVHTVVAHELAASGADRTVLNASGYVTARRQATVSSKITGKVVEVLIEEGMKVKEGQVLARLDDTNTKASLDVAVAQLESAKTAVEETRAQLKQADLEFKRSTELAAQKVLSQADLDKAEADARTLEARLARQERDVIVAERQVAMWRQQMEDLIIRSPFDGVATTKDAQPGEMISPVSAGGGFTRTGIGTVVDMKSLEIEIDVNESYIGRVQAGQAVEAVLDAYPEWKIPCKVIAVIPAADRQKSTVKVRVAFDQLDPRILPDMAVKVGFRESGASSRAVAIAKSAVRSQGGRDIVFVVHDGRAERRAVNISGAQGDEAVLGAGLSAGEKVVMDPPEGLGDGAAVKEQR